MSAYLAVAILALAVFTGSSVIIVRAVVSYTIAPPATPPDPSDRTEPDLWRSELDGQMKQLTLAVSEGIERTDRAEKRVRKTITAARKLLKDSGLEHPALEAEADEIRERDDQGIQPLPAMPEILDPPKTIRIPGGHLTIGIA